MEPQKTRPSDVSVGPSGGVSQPSVAPGVLPPPLHAPGSTEAANGAVDAAHLQQAMATPVADVPQHLQTNPGPQVGMTPSALTATGTPAIADDGDLIEKEWVLKAKQIVDRSKSDPFLQSRELNKLKAEYIKKRYNKVIKLPES